MAKRVIESAGEQITVKRRLLEVPLRSKTSVQNIIHFKLT